MKRLMLVSTQSIHIRNYIEMIQDEFEEIVLITTAAHPEIKVRQIVKDFRLVSLKNFFIRVSDLEREIKSFQPDLVHIHQVGSLSYFMIRAARKAGVKTVLTAWGSDILVNPHKNFLYKYIVRYSLQNADALTADAVNVMDKMRHLLHKPEQKILWANYGIRVVPRKVEKEKLIYSNRLHLSLYRIDKIIVAFSKFVQQYPDDDWQLLIGATGKQTNELKQLVKELKIDHQVTFCGWVDEQINADNYNRALYFVSIPESDATSISLLEAMACDCIPVVSDLAANRSWIKHGENGIVVKDVESSFFEEVFLLDAERARSINRNLIAEHGTTAGNKKKFIQLYHSVLNEQK